MRKRGSKLTRKQRRYREGLLAGKSKRRAALDAGYSMASANNAGFNIERRGRGPSPLRELLDAEAETIAERRWQREQGAIEQAAENGKNLFWLK